MNIFAIHIKVHLRKSKGDPFLFSDPSMKSFSVFGFSVTDSILEFPCKNGQY